MKSLLSATLTVCVLTACSGGASGPATPSPGAPAPASAPWSSAKLNPLDVPSVYTTEWNKAENRATCALVAPRSTGVTNATARAATFGGGWAVAYDLPDRRSAFGIAGAGVEASAPSYNEWPHRLQWSDGSTAGYGPEGGGATEKQLAYLRINGQGCLYNVWSWLGKAHLEQLLSELRFVQTTSR